MLDIVWHRLCHCVLLRYFIDQSSYFYLATLFTPCPNVFLFLKFTWYSYFPTLTCKCLESHFYNGFFNSPFIIAVWLDLLYKFLGVFFCSTVNTSWLISSLLYRKGGILLSPCLWNQEEYSPEAAWILTTLEGYTHRTVSGAICGLCFY